ncbi:MAG: BTAD domain-containing putative transcriptional regulator [Desulfovibrionales bacterium]
MDKTKTMRPVVNGCLFRQRLFDQIDESGEKTIWISSPAGAGKTTLISSYLQNSGRLHLWYRVDRYDADPFTFHHHLHSSVCRLLRVEDSLHPVPRAGNDENVFWGTFFSELASTLSGSLALVLDNVQEIIDQSLLRETLPEVLLTLPENMQFIFLARTDPPLAFSKLRSRGKLKTLNWRDIRLTRQETQDLLALHNAVVSPEELDVIYDRVEGWAAGLVLFLEKISLKNDRTVLSPVLPRQEYFDFFAVEIFGSLTKDVCSFLLELCIMPLFTAEMARDLTGMPGSESILENLICNNVFIERQEMTTPVYRFHPLFREFLLSKAGQTKDYEELILKQRQAAELLESHGYMDQAVTLFFQCGATGHCSRIVRDLGPCFLQQGRTVKLEQWLDMLEPTMGGEPWLLYWKGICSLSHNPAQSRVFLEEAFHHFDAEEDLEGRILTWSAIVNTFLLEWNDFMPLDRWIDWLESFLENGGCFPSSRSEAEATTGMAKALVIRRPYHPRINEWVDRALHLSRESSDHSLFLSTCTYAMNFSFLMGDQDKGWEIVEEVRHSAMFSDAAPLAVMTWKWLEIAVDTWINVSHEEGLCKIRDALHYGQEYGIHLWDYMLHSLGTCNALSLGKMELAKQFIKDLGGLLDPKRRHMHCNYHYLLSWRSHLMGDPAIALAHARISLRIAEETGYIFPIILCRLATARVLHRSGKTEEALLLLDRTSELCSSTGSKSMKFSYLLAQAQIAFDQGQDRDGTTLLEKALKLGKRNGLCTLIWWWDPPAMADLLTRALEAKIEPAYVHRIMNMRNLIPESTSIRMAGWTWPVRVNTLGAFCIRIQGDVLPFSRKMSKKPLEMLKVMIAYGGRAVIEDKIMDALWPDAEGDAAHQSFATTLHRLRKILGNTGTILLSDRRISLNLRLVWVDVMAFEEYVAAADEQAYNLNHTEEALGLYEAAIDLYEGHFLEEEEEKPWTVFCRERLRSRFSHAVSQAGSILENSSQVEKAISLYERALVVEEISESLHLMIIRTLYRSGRIVEALDSAERLRKVLAAHGKTWCSETAELVGILKKNS